MRLSSGAIEAHANLHSIYGYLRVSISWNNMLLWGVLSTKSLQSVLRKAPQESSVFFVDAISISATSVQHSMPFNYTESFLLPAGFRSFLHNAQLHTLFHSMRAIFSLYSFQFFLNPLQYYPPGTTSFLVVVPKSVHSCSRTVKRRHPDLVHPPLLSTTSTLA